jgi:membrane associated rhomboid family serine protease
LIAAQAAVFALGFFQILEQGKPVGLYVYNGVAPVQGELLVARSFVEAGDWWRLWSYALVHGGLLHLALNLYGHWLDASLAERMWGRWRFTAMYLIAVLGGGVGAVLSSAHGTVGSSGGWCGVVAAQAVWIIMHRHRLLPAERRMWTQYYLRAAFLITAISLVPGVSWGGHLGGAVGGALAAMIAQMTLARPGVVRWIGAIVFVTLPIATVFGLLTLLRTW